MQYSRLIARCNKFSKLADRTNQLEHLLKQVLMGDRESYLIFLDLLEEDRPSIKNDLVALDNFHIILMLLADNFPNVIDRENFDFMFRTHTFGGFHEITLEHNKTIIRYSTFTYIHNITDGTTSIEFLANHPELENMIITAIKEYDSGNLEIYGTGESELIDKDNPDYQILYPIFDKLATKAVDDLDKLEKIFLG